MNPLAWKREHQIALVCAIALGCLIGMIFGVFVTPRYVSFRWGKLWCDYSYNCTYFLQGYWLLIVLWTFIGGLVGCGLVYVRQLLRT